jgi:hypothetical protein
MFHSSISKYLLLISLISSGYGIGLAQEVNSPATTANSPWSRIVMIGASATAGFTLSEPFGGTNTLKCRLNYYFDAALTVPHVPVTNFSSAMFFRQPEFAGESQLRQAINQRPEAVIAVDFLFWYCYGAGLSDVERLRRVERGLKSLEAIKCPLIIGDIPDLASATNGGVLQAAQVPGEDVIPKANQLLKEWAAARPNVSLVPLADFIHAIQANLPLTIRSEDVPARATRGMLQRDQLHPNAHGAATLALAVLDALVSHHPRFPAADVRWDLAEVLRLGSEAAVRSGSPNSSSASVPVTK